MPVCPAVMLQTGVFTPKPPSCQQVGTPPTVVSRDGFSRRLVPAGGGGRGLATAGASTSERSSTRSVPASGSAMPTLRATASGGAGGVYHVPGVQSAAGGSGGLWDQKRHCPEAVR